MTTKLIRLQPPPCAGLRLIPAEQLHLTLHFIGAAAIAPTADALQTVRARPFALQLAGLGQFRTRAGVTLWAGVELNEALLVLHDAVVCALSDAAVGAQLPFNARPYQAHISLARGKSVLPAEVLLHFFASEAGMALPEMTVRDFALYSSITGPAGPQYRCEQRFQLVG